MADVLDRSLLSDEMSDDLLPGLDEDADLDDMSEDDDDMDESDLDDMGEDDDDMDESDLDGMGEDDDDDDDMDESDLDGMGEDDDDDDDVGEDDDDMDESDLDGMGEDDDDDDDMDESDLDGMGEDDDDDDDVGEDDDDMDESDLDGMGEDDDDDDDMDESDLDGMGEDDDDDDDVGEDDDDMDESDLDGMGEDDDDDDDMDESDLDGMGEDDDDDDDVGEDDFDELGSEDRLNRRIARLRGRMERLQNLLDGGTVTARKAARLQLRLDRLQRRIERLESRSEAFGAEGSDLLSYLFQGEPEEDALGLDVSELASLPSKKLRAIAKNPFRKKAIRAAARAELAKRGASVKKASKRTSPEDEEAEAVESMEMESDDGEDEDFGGLLPESEMSDDLEYIEDGRGVDDYVEFVEAFGGEPAPDRMGGVSFALKGLVDFLTLKSVREGISKQIKYDRHQLVAAMPYLTSDRLRMIRVNPLRKPWVRSLAAAELRRRKARKAAGRPVQVLPVPPGGRINVTRQIPMSRIQAFTQKYSTDQKASSATVRRDSASAPSSVTAQAADTNAARRMRERAQQRSEALQAKIAKARREKLAKSAPALRPPLARPLPGAPQRPVLPRAVAVRRGGRNEDLLGDLMGAEGDPTIGQSIMAHPFQALLIGTALFGVGALVGKERIIDAGLAVGDAVSGATHRTIRGARERRAAR